LKIDSRKGKKCPTEVECDREFEVKGPEGDWEDKITHTRKEPGSPVTKERKEVQSNPGG